uniref:Chitin-binding type-4 domain-containing protein n=1 Tax=Aplanochytrium stocchinoi TaxID=215587 RepID=A0A7S3PS57_9STRA|mmetsp:Transcript_13084/g.14902  ORF Transcript_13084/g.14902 Transcript_13084/m.14902 type:complete len:370 (+) Transcript_13084:44-1153(+)
MYLNLISLAVLSALALVASEDLSSTDFLIKNVRQALGSSDFPPDLTEAQKRELQQGNNLKLCALPHSPGQTRNFILVNVNRNSRGTLRWLPYGDACVEIKNNQNEIKFDWQVVPQNDPEGPILTVEATFKNKKPFTDCWCAGEDFAGSVENPNYGKVDKKCTISRFMNRPDDAADLLFCPKCEGGICGEANKKRDEIGSPKPIWLNWNFYTEVEGKLGGEGLALFRQEVEKSFPQTKVEPPVTTCTLSVLNVPVPQFGCSDLDNPEDGYGFGVNVKNLECGFATWFNCVEDLPQLGGSANKLHVADINFNLGRCPTPAPVPTPTPPPTNFPTPKPQEPCVDYDCCKLIDITIDECNDLGGIFCPGDDEN